jgi:hypothetical protein
MKSHTEYLTFNTRKYREYIHITPQVEAALKKSGVREGMVLVSAMHITAGLYVNDNESRIDRRHRPLAGRFGVLPRRLPSSFDWREQQRLAPEVDAGASRRDCADYQCTLDLGPWQRVFYAEFDGQRSKRLIIKVGERWCLRAKALIISTQ